MYDSYYNQSWALIKISCLAKVYKYTNKFKQAVKIYRQRGSQG